MFEARYADSKVFKMIIEAMKELFTEGNLDCTKSGITMQSMDSSHVSLISLLLRGEGFENFRCDRALTLGIEMATLSKILKCAANTDALSLSATEGKDNLNFTFESKNGERVSDFSMKLMDIDGEHLSIPDKDYESTVRMPSAEFQRICRDLATMGDSATIAINKDNVKFSVSGDMGTGNVCLKTTTNTEKEEEKVMIHIAQPVELTFALRYLNMFTKATPLSSSVTLQLSQNLPLVVEYPIGEMGYIRYYLAPKINEE